MEVEVGRHRDDATRGMQELLGSLSKAELTGLLKTSTSSLISYGDVTTPEGEFIDARTHAITTIMQYNDAISLLNKQRMRRDILATYLNKKRVKMTMPPTKFNLSRDVLVLWGQQVPDNLTLIDDEAMAGRPRENGTGPRAAIKDEVKPSCADLNNSQNQSSSGQSSHAHEVSGSLAQSTDSSNPLVPVESSLERVEIETAMSLRQREAELGQQLGKEFSAWFYERLNSLTDFTTAHFWSECNFRMEIIFSAQPENTVVEENSSADICCAKLKDLVAVKQLYFNPHVETGVRGYLNPHGLAQVMVCGTLYQNGNNYDAVGVYEQMFGLMKDPRLGNNYKIKFTILRLREGAQLAIQNTPPELTDSTLVGIIEEIDDD